MSELEDLIARVEALSGADREVDAEIEQAIFGSEVQWRQSNYTMDMHPVGRRPSSNYLSGFEHFAVPPCTSSIDAALAFAERVLPGREMELHINKPNRDWQTALVRVAPLKMIAGEAPTLPLAIILATLKAKVSE